MDYHTPTFARVADNGIDFLGFNVHPHHIKMRQYNKQKMRRLRKLAYKGSITEHEFRRIYSVLGYPKGVITDDSLIHYILNYQKNYYSPSLHQLLMSS